MGAATGWRLAARGLRPTCFDRHSPPHALGSSHGETRVTRTAYYEGAWYVPLLRRTFPLWRELEATTAADLLSLTGALMIGRPADTVVSGALAAAAEHRLDTAVLTATEIRERYPGHRVRDDEVAVVDVLAGFVRPEAAIAAMIARLTALGGVVRRDLEVTGVRGRRDGVEVVTPEGRQLFDRVVVSAGARVRGLLPWLPVTVSRQVLAWFEIDRGAGWLTPDRFPVYFHHTPELGDIYGLPTVDGRTVKLAGHHPGEPADPDSIRREVAETDIAPLRAFAERHLRGVTGRVARAAVCMYTNTVDRDFVVDRHPDDPRIVIVSACSGHGFKFAPVIGEIAADLATEGATSHDIGHFALSRLRSGAGEPPAGAP
jgi:sarcosine oxidase